MTDRLPCCVPFCRRTFKNDEGFVEMICGKHWRMASQVKRRRRTRLFRAYRKRFGDNDYWNYPAGSPQRIAAVRLHRLCQKAWQSCKRDAIERAAGI